MLFIILFCIAYSLVISYKADVIYCGHDIYTSNVKGKGGEMLVNGLFYFFFLGLIPLAFIIAFAGL